MEGDARALAKALTQSRLVVFDEELDLVWRWNGSATFNVCDLGGQDIAVFETASRVDVDEAARAIALDRETYQ